MILNESNEYLTIHSVEKSDYGIRVEVDNSQRYTRWASHPSRVTEWQWGLNDSFRKINFWKRPCNNDHVQVTVNFNQTLTSMSRHSCGTVAFQSGVIYMYRYHAGNKNRNKTCSVRGTWILCPLPHLSITCFFYFQITWIQKKTPKKPSPRYMVLHTLQNTHQI